MTSQVATSHKCEAQRLGDWVAEHDFCEKHGRFYGPLDLSLPSMLHLHLILFSSLLCLERFVFPLLGLRLLIDLRLRFRLIFSS